MPYTAAVIDAGLGKIDEAFAALDRASAERSYLLGVYPDTDERLDKPRADPRFDVLKRHVGLPRID